MSRTITVTLPEERFSKLRELADRRGLAPEDLARLGVEELLGRPDEEFVKLVDHLLGKNAELLRRLAR